MENAPSLINGKDRQVTPKTELVLCGHHSASWFWEVLMGSPVCQLHCLQKPLGIRKAHAISKCICGGIPDRSN